jgi:hypothetical protein
LNYYPPKLQQSTIIWFESSTSEISQKDTMRSDIANILSSNTRVTHCI